ncbi:Epidermal retinol dehydrogenase 2 [Halotydeus destructor]|nr:Epidermal retinol dehydrogenase 2 [Halotydeus destructor]
MYLTTKKIALCIWFFVRSLVYPFIPRKYLVKDVSGSTVLITGGGAGLGRLMAQRFGRLGSKVVIWDIDKVNLKTTEAMIRQDGGQCFAYVCDVSDSQSVYKMADTVRQEVGQVEILVLNAGIVNGKPLLELEDDRIRKCFEVNTLSHFWLIKAFLPNMMAINKGHIISIDSVSAFYGTYCLTDYCASKSASHRLQDAISSELRYSGYDGIKMTSIMPYFMDTGMFSGSSSKLIGILDPVYVANECVDAILTGRTSVMIPKIFHIFLVATLAVPYKSFFAFHEAIFGGNMMKNFRGRHLDSKTTPGDKAPDNNNQLMKRKFGFNLI